MSDDQFDIVIEKGRTESNYWRDLSRFRELFYILSWRDIKVRYKQTVVGTSWVFIRPLLTMIVFTFAFNKVAKLPSPDETPYALLVLAGLLPWQFFSTSMSDASNSLIGNTNLITKVYFPRLIIPASSVITGFVDLIVSFGLLLLVLIYYQFVPSVNIVFLPIFLILVFFLSFGLGIYLTALNVKYRDFRYIIPFVIQFGLYLSPVGYVSDIVPSEWRVLFSINPMVGVIDGFRWSILGFGEFPFFSVTITVIATIVTMIFGIWYFRRTERSFADSI